MADNEVSVTFSDDRSKLNLAVTQAKANLSGLGAAAGQTAAGLNTINISLKEAGGASSGYSSTIRDAAQTTAALAATASSVVDVAGAMLGKLRDVAVIAASTVYVTKELGGGLVAIAEAAGSAAYALGALAVSGTIAVFRDEAAAISAADAVMGSYVESLGYAQRGAEMFVVKAEVIPGSISAIVAATARATTATAEWLNFTGRVSTAVAEAYNSLRVYHSDLAKTEMTAIAAAGGLKTFENALGAAGNVGAKETLSDINLELEKIPGITDDSAKSIVAMLTAIPNYSVASTNVLVQFLQTFAKTGDEAKRMTKEFKEAFTDQTNGGQTLGNIAGTIKNMDALVAVTKQWAASLSPAQATAMFDTVEKGLNSEKALIEGIDQQNDAALSKLGALGTLYSSANEILTGEHALHAQNITAIERENALLEVQRQGQLAITEETRKQGEYRAAIEAASTPTTKINDLESTRDTLKSNTRRDTGDQEISAQDRDAAIRIAILEAANQTDQGLLGVLNVMKNRLNANYGNYGDDLGKVLSKPGAFSSYDPTKMAAISQDSYQYKRAAGLYDQAFGDNAPDDPTKGATHYYNPGLAAPSWGSTMGNQTSIGDHKFGNADGAPVPSETDSTVSKEAIAQANTAIREQNALLAGGTDEEKQAADIAKEGLSSARDAVDEAQKLVDVRTKAVAVAKDGTPQEQAKANSALVQAQQALSDQEVARDKATNALKAAQAQEGSKERLDIQTGELSAEQSKYEEGTAKYIDLEKQKVELVKAYNAQQAASATETENAKYDAIERGFVQAQDLIKEQAKTRGISSGQEQADLTASYAAQATMARAHFAELERINAATPAMVRKYALAGSIETNKIDEQRVASARAANAEIEQSYRSAFESVGSTLASSLMAILQKTGTFKSLMQAVAKNITEQFLQAGVKMVADWGAHQLAQATLTVAGQATQTAAVAAGEAARTGLVSAGSVAQGAVVVASMIKSILASAAETFAGIFGFLSPVLGPAAVGPAAAGQATVAAMASLPSFDVGAWNLSSDMTANVHRGEMIIPASPAAAMRSGLMGAGGGADGGDTHNHYHFPIHAIDTQTGVAFIKRNAVEVAKAVGNAMRTKPSTRGAY